MLSKLYLAQKGKEPLNSLSSWINSYDYLLFSNPTSYPCIFLLLPWTFIMGAKQFWVFLFFLFKVLSKVQIISTFVCDYVQVSAFVWAGQIGLGAGCTRWLWMASVDARKGVGSSAGVAHAPFFPFNDLFLCELVFGLHICLCEGVGSSGTGIIYDSCDPPCGYWKLNPSFWKISQYS